MRFHQAKNRFEELRKLLGIPPEAELSEMEKRVIELAPDGEIEPMTSEGAHAGLEEDDADEEQKAYRDAVVWVGEFTLESLFWELAITVTGDLVRLRKGR